MGIYSVKRKLKVEYCIEYDIVHADHRDAAMPGNRISQNNVKVKVPSTHPVTIVVGFLHVIASMRTPVDRKIRKAKQTISTRRHSMSKREHIC